MEKEDLETINEQLHSIFDLLVDLDLEPAIAKKFAARTRSVISTLKDLSLRINRVGDFFEKSKLSLLSVEAKDPQLDKAFEERIADLVTQVNQLSILNEKLNEQSKMQSDRLTEMHSLLQSSNEEAAKVPKLRSEIASLQSQIDSLKTKLNELSKSPDAQADFFLRVKSEESQAEKDLLAKQFGSLKQLLPQLTELLLKSSSETLFHANSSSFDQIRAYLLRLAKSLDAFVVILGKMGSVVGIGQSRQLPVIESESNEFTLNPRTAAQKVEAAVLSCKAVDLYSIIKAQAFLLEKRSLKLD